MAETILCAVDDSEMAGRVLDIARELADTWGAGLVAVHAVGGPNQGADGVVASARTRLSRAGMEPDVRLVQGPPARAIMETVDREDPELLVVGARGRGPLRSAALGSVSRELASRARCPVVIVPSRARLAETTRDADASVVCGVDGSDQALAAAALAGRLASRLGWRLVVVHARQNPRAVAAYPGASRATPPVSGQEDAVQRLAAEVVKAAEDAAGVSAVRVVEPGPPTEVLESVAEREAARLIVIGARGVGALRAALLGSVAAELPVVAARPVMVAGGLSSGAGV